MACVANINDLTQLKCRNCEWNLDLSDRRCIFIASRFWHAGTDKGGSDEAPAADWMTKQEVSDPQTHGGMNELWISMCSCLTLITFPVSVCLVLW